MNEAEDTRNMISLLEKYIQLEQQIVIFGFGMMGRLMLQYFFQKKYRVACIIDNNSDLWGKKIKKVSIISPQQGKQKYTDAIYIICNTKYGEEMKSQLLDLGINRKNIIICDSQSVIQQEINKMLPMQYENKYLIFDNPYKKGIKHKLDVIGWQIKALYYECLMNVFYPVKIVEKKYKVSVCAIFKNEAPYLEEWIEYHKLVGIDHFYLYNNFSNDDYMTILKKYIDDGIVTLIDWPYKQAQVQAYSDCIKKRAGESKWIGFIDLDEFVVPIDTLQLYDILKKFEKNRGSIILYWKMFGSSGRLNREMSGLVTEDFVVSWRKHINVGKVFYNTAYDFNPDDEKNRTLHHSMWTSYKGLKMPPVNAFNKVCIEGLNPVRENFPIQINHYFTKSLEEWREKQVKGDVYYKKNPHDERYFDYHEMKCGKIDVSVYKYLIKLKKKLER